MKLQFFSASENGKTAQCETNSAFASENQLSSFYAAFSFSYAFPFQLPVHILSELSILQTVFSFLAHWWIFSTVVQYNVTIIFIIFLPFYLLLNFHSVARLCISSHDCMVYRYVNLLITFVNINILEIQENLSALFLICCCPSKKVFRSWGLYCCTTSILIFFSSLITTLLYTEILVM